MTARLLVSDLTREERSATEEYVKERIEVSSLNVVQIIRNGVLPMCRGEETLKSVVV